MPMWLTIASLLTCSPAHMMMLTIPLPVYGLFRYLYLIHIRGETAAPDEVLLKDRHQHRESVTEGSDERDVVSVHGAFPSAFCKSSRSD